MSLHQRTCPRYILSRKSGMTILSLATSLEAARYPLKMKRKYTAAEVLDEVMVDSDSECDPFTSDSEVSVFGLLA